MTQEGKYRMSMSLNVLNHLGMNLYSNNPAVLSEVVANSYDADATTVEIVFKDGEVVLVDDGNGMSLKEINEKYLYVGYDKRANGEALSPKYKRPVMGRKGIGKLSLFSIANEIEVHSAKPADKGDSVEKNGFILRKSDIVKQIGAEGNDQYYPQEIDRSSIEIEKGTRIAIRDFKRNVNHAESFLKRRLARRFTIIGPEYNFQVSINGEPITIEDRDFFDKIQFIWFIGEENAKISKKFSFEKVSLFNGQFDDGSPYSIRGWIGAVREAGDLNIDSINNNKISILSRGKLAQEDILDSFNEGGFYATYLIGEIEADFLDVDDDEDIATSSRQRINENDPRYQALQAIVYKLLKNIQGTWSKWRTESAEALAVQKAENFNPVLKEWYDSLKSDSSRIHAKKLFATIETMHFLPSEAKEKKKELYTQGILAFEKLKLKDSLHELSKFTDMDDPRMAIIFNDLSDIEANLYYDIASERVQVIREFQRKLEANDKERLLQKYLFDNLWLMNPSWERATAGTEVMEARVESAFKTVVDSLSEDEKRGRIDIKYRTSAGKHIVVELKRYNPTYPVSQFKLMEQASKYKEAVIKCLETLGQAKDPVEILIVLGKRVTESERQESEFQEGLKAFNARVLYYDFLIEQSLLAYSDYLAKQKEVSRIRSIIEKI